MPFPQDYPTSIKPTYGAVKKSAPAVRSIKFGSGYEQRATFGINQNPKIYEALYKLTAADADKIEQFLDDKDGVTSFTLPALFPGQVTTDKFVCRSWTRTVPTDGVASITVTFEQVFE